MSKIIKVENEDQAFNDFHDCTCHEYVMNKIQEAVDNFSDIDIELDPQDPVRTTIKLGTAQGIRMELVNLKEDL